MICKKCEKDFKSDNNICTFCNHDNNVEENEQATNTTEQVETNQDSANNNQSNITTPIKEKSEIESLFDDEIEAKEEPVIEDEKEALVDSKNQTTTEETTPDSTSEKSPETVSAKEEQFESIIGSTTENKTETEQTKKQISPRTVFLLLLILVLVIVVVIMYLPKDEEKPTPPTRSQTNQSNANKNPSVEAPDEILSYSGVYQNDDVEITMYATSSSTINFTVATSSGETINYTSYNLNLGNNYLYASDTKFDEDIDIRVEKVRNRIEVTASSSKVDSVLNKINNAYIKGADTTSSWSGIYTYNNIELVIDHYQPEKLAVSYATKDDIKRTFVDITTFDETTITYENNIKLNITKTETGIDVNATSLADPEEDYSYLNGAFSKVN